MIFRLLAETLLKRGEPGWTQEVDRAQTRELLDYALRRARMESLPMPVWECENCGVPRFCVRFKQKLFSLNSAYGVFVRFEGFRVSVVLPTRCV